MGAGAACGAAVRRRRSVGMARCHGHTRRGVWAPWRGYHRDMVDRIAEPWGTRTPYGRGERWPVRVDTRLVGVRGRAESRVNHGRLGPKDLFGWQANHAQDRLTRPLVRRDGALVET